MKNISYIILLISINCNLIYGQKKNIVSTFYGTTLTFGFEDDIREFIDENSHQQIQYLFGAKGDKIFKPTFGSTLGITYKRSITSKSNLSIDLNNNIYSMKTDFYNYSTTGISGGVGVKIDYHSYAGKILYGYQFFKKDKLSMNVFTGIGIDFYRALFIHTFLLNYIQSMPIESSFLGLLYERRQHFDKEDTRLILPIGCSANIHLFRQLHINCLFSYCRMAKSFYHRNSSLFFDKPFNVLNLNCGVSYAF